MKYFALAPAALACLTCLTCLTCFAPITLPQAKVGKLRALATAGAKID